MILIADHDINEVADLDIIFEKKIIQFRSQTVVLSCDRESSTISNAFFLCLSIFESSWVLFLQLSSEF
jgi:hypothetical protein